MTPIEKNIHVVDEQGNVYEATWPKRARGLVKNGRARFISEDTICLACPPNADLEDTEMNDNKVELSWLLEQITAIQNGAGYLQAVISEISGLEPGETTKAGVLKDIALCRETTNQQLLRLYEKMYDDLMGRRTGEA